MRTSWFLPHHWTIHCPIASKTRKTRLLLFQAYQKYFFSERRGIFLGTTLTRPWPFSPFWMVLGVALFSVSLARKTTNFFCRGHWIFPDILKQNCPILVLKRLLASGPFNPHYSVVFTEFLQKVLDSWPWDRGLFGNLSLWQSLFR
jgi:hypothetical protein